MDVKELRIGNWVKICFTDKEGWEEVQVTDIRHGGSIDTTSNMNERYYFEPICLSNDILLNCGFKQDHVYKYRYQNGSVILHFTMIDYHKKESSANRAWQLALDHGEYLTPMIQSLHQLQNLFFALTKEELIYKP